MAYETGTQSYNSSAQQDNASYLGKPDTPETRSEIVHKRLAGHTDELMQLAMRLEKAGSRLLGGAPEPLNTPKDGPQEVVANNHSGHLNLALNNFERLRQRLSAAMSRIEEFV